MDGPVTDSFLTLFEVAALLKVAVKPFYTIAQRGQLPALNLRGQLRFKRSDLEQWIEDQKAVTRGDAFKGGAHD